MMENGIQCLARKGVLHQVNQEATLLKKVGWHNQTEHPSSAHTSEYHQEIGRRLHPVTLIKL